MQLAYNILIVDDVLENIRVVMNILKEDSYDFAYARSGEEALELLEDQQFDLILLDIMMPGIDGYEVCRRIKMNPTLAEIPIIFLTAKTDVDSISKSFEVGGTDYITKPFHADELLARTKTHLEFYKAKELLRTNNMFLENKVIRERDRVLSEVVQNQLDMVYVLTELIESVSDETGKHVRRVAEYSKLLAYHHKAMSEEDEELIFYAAPLHDIGKMAISKSILHKKGTLTEEEFEIMKTHTSIAHQYLKLANRKIMRAADSIAYEHHEKWNGEGYPQGLKGEEIHIYGRIVALADVFDALTHKRVYKDSWSMDEAVEYIIQKRGIQFDPYLVDIFEEHIDEFISISKL